MTTMDNIADCDAEVVIVGGGPVGMGLAIELGQRGIRTLVIERHPQPQPIPKGQNLTQRTMEHFYCWGAEASVRAARPIPRGQGIGGLTTYRTLFSGYAYDWLQRDLVQPYYFRENERLPQYSTEDVLRQRASELEYVKTLYGWNAERVVQGDKYVDIQIKEHRGQARQTLSAPYAVGCDGSKSVVREQAGIAQSRSDHEKLMALLVFRSAELHELLAERFPGKSFFNVLHPDLKGYWLFFGRVDLNQTFFFHAPVPADTTAENFDFKSYLHRAAGQAFHVDIQHVGFWDLRFSIADSYQRGRLFIAGDAAHDHPPYGGYGINTGFEDARNLGWKLAARLRGWGNDRLLETYTEERRPVFQSTADDFIEKCINDDRHFLETYDPEHDRERFEAEWRARGCGAQTEVDAFEPNYQGSSAVWGPRGAVSTAKGSHRLAARAGHHLSPLQLSSGENVFEALGSGFTLIALDADDVEVAEFENAAARLELPFVVIRDRLTEELQQYEARFMLVRPDHFVAWVATRRVEQNPTTILAQAVGQIVEAERAQSI